MPAAHVRRFGSALGVVLSVTLAGSCALQKEREKTPSPAPSARTPASGAQQGKASYYGADFHGRKTASGERFDMHGMTAAHRTLAMGTHVRVTNTDNGRSVVVRINDRGPYADGRVIDVSYAAARQLGMIGAGVVPVKVEVLKKTASN
jgi:rare lipoprotein A